MEPLRDQLFRYRVDSLYLGRAHYKAAERAETKHRVLGGAGGALSAIVGTAIFGTLSEQPGLGWRVVAGIVSLAAAVLTTLQTFLGQQGRAEAHRAAGLAYASLRRTMDGLVLDLDIHPDADAAAPELVDVRNRLDAIAKESPLIPDKAYRVADREIKEESKDPLTSVGAIFAEKAATRGTP